MTEILTIGEPLVLFAANDLNLDLAHAKHFTKYLAGAEVNFAIGVHRLGHSVEYISQVGKDPLGTFVINGLKDADIKTDAIQQTSSFHTGVEFKNFTNKGDPETFYIRKNSAAAHINIHSVSLLQNLSHLKVAHLTGIFPALSEFTYQTTLKVIKTLRENKICISFDPNLRPALWGNQKEMCLKLNLLAKKANIFMPGLNEARILTNLKEPNDIAKFYFNESSSLELIVIKDGSKGAYAFSRNLETQFIPCFQVKHVVDTVGAGDGFAVGLITALLEKKSIKEAVIRANAIGAMAVQVQGDNTGYPTVEQLKKFLASNAVK